MTYDFGVVGILRDSYGNVDPFPICDEFWDGLCCSEIFWNCCCCPKMCILAVAVLGKILVGGGWPLIIWEAATAKRNYYRNYYRTN